MNDYEKAGKIAGEALDYGKGLIKVGAKLLDVADKIEDKIKKLGGECAFPAQISLNEVAAHYCPFENDETQFKEGDVASLDVGVHINGFIGDNAVSVDLGGNKELVEASRKALNEAIKIIKPGVKLNEIGSAIGETITGLGFNPVRNLSGHGLGEYEIHTFPTVPNFDNGDETEVEDGQVLAIEPFATTGSGFIEEGKESGIYALQALKNTRVESVRKVLRFIAENYQTLPFSGRWLKLPNAKFALRILERDGVLKHYKQLVEKSKGLVSQAEHTVLVGEKTKILTKI